MHQRPSVIGLNFVCIGLFEFFRRHGEYRPFDEIRRNPRELNVAVVFIPNGNHRQSIAFQNIGLAVQSSSKRGNLHGLVLERSIGEKRIVHQVFGTGVRRRKSGEAGLRPASP